MYNFFALKNNSIIVNQMRNDHKFPTEEHIIYSQSHKAPKKEVRDEQRNG